MQPVSYLYQQPAEPGSGCDEPESGCDEPESGCDEPESGSDDGYSDDNVDSYIADIRVRYTNLAPDESDPGYETMMEYPYILENFHRGSPPLLMLESLLDETDLDACYQIANTPLGAWARCSLGPECWERGEYEEWVYGTYTSSRRSRKRDSCPKCDRHVLDVKHMSRCSKTNGIWKFQIKDPPEDPDDDSTWLETIPHEIDPGRELGHRRVW